MPMAAIIETMGVMTFVQSSLPPRPHSTTATCAPASRKYQKASAVPISKVVGETPVRSNAAQAAMTSRTPRKSAASGMHWPFTRMRSR